MIAVMIAGAVAMLVSLFGTRFLITFFRNRGKGQPILGKEDRGPEHHMHKQGTPTMGGLAIVGRRVRRVGGRPLPARPGVLQPGRRSPGSASWCCRSWASSTTTSRSRKAPQPRHLLEEEELHHAWRSRWASPGGWWPPRGISETISFTRYNWPGWHLPWPVWVVFAGVDDLEHVQRGQRHRRPRRPRRRRRPARLPGVHDHRLLGVPQPGDLRRRRRGCRQPARPRRARRRVRRGVRWLPVVQRRAGAHLHGRRRRAWRSAPRWRCWP